MPPPTRQAPERLGPFEVVRPLGRGGMGDVYLGRREDGQEVALKTVQVPDESLVFSLRREIHALSRLSHPCIVRILEHGLHDGLPWYAMQVEPGTSLRSLVPRETAARPETDWWTHTLTVALARTPDTGAVSAPAPVVAAGQAMSRLAPLLDVFRYLCSALGYMHGEGMVHRDLKPENVIVRPDGTPSLVDFGLAVTFDAPGGREVLDANPTSSMGTASYILREQLRGELLDARADLYALGCMLHEVVVGAPPFSGRMDDVVSGHVARRPPRLDRVARGVPPELADLVDALLEKRTEDRPSHADEVAAVLVRLGAREKLPPHWPAPAAFVFRPTLRGRSHVMRSLQDSVGEAARGRGALVLLAGESGAGKTRLLLEVARVAELSGLRVLAGECLPADGGRPSAERLAVLRRPLQALADLCRAAGPDGAARLLGSRWPSLARVEPEIARLPHLPAAQAPAPLPADEERVRLLDDVLVTLQALGAERPLMLALDDLQWADAATLELLLRIATTRSLASSSVLVVGAFRAEERPDALARAAEAGASTQELARLGASEVKDVVRAMIGAEPPPELVAAIIAHSEGNAFFVTELLRSAVVSGLLARGTDGRWTLAAGASLEALPIPSSVRGLVRERLARLDDVARELAEWAAVRGREIEPGALAALSGLGTEALLEPVRVLVGAFVLEQTPAGALRFVHDKIREVLLGDIGPARRPSLHLRVAEHLVASGAGGGRSAEIAAHWEAGGDRARARDAWLVAARRAVDESGRAEAARFYERHLALAEHGTERTRARAELARCLVEAGRVDEGLAEAESALREARRQGEASVQADLHDAIAGAFYVQGRFELARTSCAQARALHEKLGERRGIAREIGRLSSIAYAEGDVAGSRDLALEGLEAHRDLGDSAAVAETLSRLCVQHRDLGDLAQARGAGEEALAIAREVGARRVEAMTLSRLAFVARQQGRPADCVRLSEDALVLHRRQGDAFWTGVAAGNMAVAQRDLGWVQESTLSFADATATLAGMGEAHWLQVTRGHSALLSWDLGRLDEAREKLEEARSRLQDVGDVHWDAVFESVLGAVLLDQGEVDAAEEALGRSVEALARHRDGAHQAAALVTSARLALVARGDEDRAERLVGEAESLFARLEHEMGRAACLVLRGHLALARGLPAAAELDAAKAAVRRAGCMPESELARRVADLAAATAAPPGQLVHGVLPERLPVDLRRVVGS